MLIGFITSKFILTNKKDDNYNFMFVIFNEFIKIVYYKFSNTIINTLSLAKIIINIIVKYHSFSNLNIIKK